jgi:hypothetical protein
VHLRDVQAGDGPGGEKILSRGESSLLFKSQRIDKCLDICQFVTPYALHDARERYSHDYKNNSATLQEPPLRAGGTPISPIENACLSSLRSIFFFYRQRQFQSIPPFAGTRAAFDAERGM